MPQRTCADVLRLAMWSGPRNVSTAFMRSWGNREDTLVVDEPFYAHYLDYTGLDHPGREWLGSMTHAFLIRDPRPMLASLGEKLDEFDLLATGLPQQVEIFDHVVRTHGHVPPVVDAADLLAAPEALLRALCTALDVPFTPRMLSWPAGPRATDGVWATHWYDRVERSTGFEPQSERAAGELAGRLAEIEALCRPMYDKLREHRLRA